MQTRLEAAVAHEILDVIEDQGRTLKWVQERSGVKARVWGYYFREGTRPIPFAALASICEVLGVRTSDIIARAEDVEVESLPAATLSEHITRQLSPDAQEAVRIASSQVAKRGKRAQPNG